MESTPQILGRRPEGLDVTVDLDGLIGNHLCVVANSGGGKSGFIRRLLEVTAGRVQQIILDPEDEFYTLRESFDMILAGGDGDCPATVANAADMATVLLSTGISAVIQMNHLLAHEQEMFVAKFLTQVMASPQSLWHPCLFILDEAHRWGPQGGGSVAFDAMKDFTSRGRKRGYTGVMATQRMAKLDKNLTDSVNNWALGRVGQATDRRTMADALGFGPKSPEAMGLQTMEARNFWVFGQAFSAPVPQKMKVAQVDTQIVKPGQAKISSRPAPEALKKLLESLSTPPAPDTPPGAAPAAQGPSQAEIEAAKSCAYQDGYMDGRKEGGEDMKERALQALQDIDHDGPARFTVHIEKALDPDSTAALVQRMVRPSPMIPNVLVNPTKPLSRAARNIVDFYNSIAPMRMEFSKAARLAGVGMKSSQFRTYKPEILAAGLLVDLGDGTFQSLNKHGSADDYLQAIYAQLTPLQSEILSFIIAAKRPVSKDDIIAGTSVSQKSSTTGSALMLLTNEAGVIELIQGKYQPLEPFR